MKYIRFKHLGLVVFEETQDHKQMAKRLCSRSDEVVSAGFVYAEDWCEDGKVCCSGRSMSLDLSPLPEDEGMLRQELRR